MRISDTVIKWNKVNMRSKEKNLPELNKRIIYYNGGIYDGVMTEINGKYYVNMDFKRKEVKTEFLWCYQSDIVQPHEIK